MAGIIERFELLATLEANTIVSAVQAAAKRVCAECNVDKDNAEQTILKHVQAALDTVLAIDGRSAWWRARIRLYEASNDKEPVADSDPNAPAGAHGSGVWLSLPAVADATAEMAAQFHGAPCNGLASATLRKKIQSLRTQISNNGDGTGTWRVPYFVAITKPALRRGMEPDAPEKTRMTARIDVIREAPAGS